MKDRAEFVEDIYIRGMIYALTIRSPVARGKLKGIICPKLPSPYQLITADQIPGKNQLADFPVPVLADDSLSYTGQPVAILTGPDQSRLEELALEIFVETEEETPVFLESAGQPVSRETGEEDAGTLPSPAGSPSSVDSASSVDDGGIIIQREIVHGNPAPFPQARGAAADSGGEETPLPEDPAREEPGNGNPAGETAPDARAPVETPDAAEQKPPGQAEKEKRVTGTYVTGIQAHWYPEPHGAVAVPSPPVSSRKAPPTARNAIAHNASGKKAEGKTLEAITVYTATQWPFHVKRSVAGLLKLDASKVSVKPEGLAVHLDGKIWYPSLVACHAALASCITGHTVKLMLTREDDFKYSPKRNRAAIGISSALGKNGEILESQVRLTLDLGAHGIFEDEIMDHTCLASLGAYNHRSFRISGTGIRTNIPPQGPMAGFGLSQGFFAAERHASRIADSIGQDPAEWRKKNFMGKDQKLAIGVALKNPMPLADLVDAAAAMSDYYRKWASYELLRSRRREKEWNFLDEPLRGIGIATAYQGNGFLYNDGKGNGNCSVELTLEKDGTLEISTSLAASGTGFMEAWQNMVQEILGVDPAQIRLNKGEGDPPDAGPGTLSRNISVLTRLVERCCTAIRKQRFRDPLPITVKRSAKPGKGAGWVPGKSIDPDSFARPSWGAAVVEVETDPVSFTPLIRGVWLAVDGGRILSQRRARRTLTTGIIQALGWTCREHVHYEGGEIPKDLYWSYDIPAPVEIPPVYVDFIWNDSADPKGIGDLPFCCVPAAYAQAVTQAVDYHFESIPLDAQHIWEAVNRKQGEGPQ